MAKQVLDLERVSREPWAFYCGVRGFFFPPSDGTYSGPSARFEFEACEVRREMMSEVLEAFNVIRPYSSTPRIFLSISAIPLYI